MAVLDQAARGFHIRDASMGHEGTDGRVCSPFLPLMPAMSSDGGSSLTALRPFYSLYIHPVYPRLSG